MNESNDLYEELTELLNCTPWDLRYVPRGNNSNIDKDYTRIYIVDMQTGWYVHGAVSVDDFKAAAEFFRRSEIKHADATLITSAVLNIANRESESDIETCLSFAALWLSCTDTFRQLEESDALNAHVFVFSYQTADGNMLLRPSLTIDNDVDFLPVDEVLGAARQVVAIDTNNTKTIVGKALTQAGGALISPVFK